MAETVLIDFQSQIDGINKAITALERLQKTDKGMADEFIKNSDKAKKATESVGQSLNSLNNTLRNVAGAVGVAFGSGALVNFGKEAVNLKAKMESLQNTFNFAFGSAAEGAKAMEFVRQLTNKLGLELLSTADAFKKFSASSILSGVSVEQSKKIFSQVSTAVSAMGLSASEAQGVFLALSQMMSKGTVNAEELRGQLGERLPGAFSLFAKSQEVSEKKLNKMLELGQVLSKDALPKFAQVLEDTFSDAATANIDSTQAKLNRLENVFTEIKITAGTSLVDFYDWLVKVDDKIEKSLDQDKGGLWSTFFGFRPAELERSKEQLNAATEAQKKLEEKLRKERIEEARTQFELLSAEDKKAIENKAFLLELETQLIKDAGKEQTAAILKEFGIQSQVKDAPITKTDKEIKDAEKAREKAIKEQEAALKQLDQLKRENIADDRERLIAQAEYEISQLKGSKATQAEIEKEIRKKLLDDLLDMERAHQKELNDDLEKINKDRQDKNKEITKQFRNQLNDADKEAQDQQDKADKDKEDKDKQKEKDEEDIQRAKFDLAAEAFNGLAELANAHRDHDIAIAKELLDAKIITEEEYNKRVKKIKREQAVIDKAQAIFNIALNTAQNVVKVFPNAVLQALAIALGAVQAGVVLAKPIPFNKGTKRVPGVDMGVDSVHAILRPGEKVFTTERSREYAPILDAIFDAKLPSSFLNKVATGEKVDGFGVDEYVMKNAFKGALRDGLIIKNFPKQKDGLSFAEYELLRRRGQ